MKKTITLTLECPNPETLKSLTCIGEKVSGGSTNGENGVECIWCEQVNYEVGPFGEKVTKTERKGDLCCTTPPAGTK